MDFDREQFPHSWGKKRLCLVSNFKNCKVMIRRLIENYCLGGCLRQFFELDQFFSKSVLKIV